MKFQGSELDNVRWNVESVDGETDRKVGVRRAFGRTGVDIHWAAREAKGNPITAHLTVELDNVEAQELYDALGKVLG